MPSRFTERLRLVKLKYKITQHPSLDIVNDFEESIIGLSDIELIPEFRNKFLKKIAQPKLIGFINSLLPKSKSPVFFISMGISEANRSIPYALFSKDNVLFLFDAWPKYYKLIAKIVKSYNVSKLFVTSRESAGELKLKLDSIDVYWCPEACNTLSYKPYEYSKKDIDVLQFGRRYNNWHNLVVDELKRLNVSYSYEKEKGELIFKSKEDFIDGLGRSKISICFPQSLTNTSISGGVSTMTNRYLQSMASRCLILGVMPDEMRDLFGYDPVIKVDMNHPVNQIVEILRNYNKYIPLIERNYEECLSNHSWRKRWIKISEVLNS